MGGALTRRLGLAGQAVLSLDDYFANNGATTPWYGDANYPVATYHSASNTTWFAWEGWDGAARIAYVTSLDHSTGYWSPIIEACPTPLVDDSHGNPSICIDDEGHLHVFYGSHNSTQFHSSTRWDVTGAPGVGSLWALREPLVGEYTYPHPCLIGTNIHLLLRKTISASTKAPLVVFSTTALVAGLATWAAEKTLVDLGTDSRFYAGPAFVVGTDIHLVATRADYADTVREHLYYFIYDTVTGAVKNHDASVTVASGSLPVALAQANSDFRLFTHSGGNDDGGIPVFCFDTNGDPHVVFKDGAGSAYDIKHIKKTAGTWSSPVTVATADGHRTAFGLVPVSGARVEFWYVLDPGASWPLNNGNIVRKVRSSAGVWGNEHTVLTADTVGLADPSAVLNGHADARVVWSERAADDLDTSAGDLRTYVYGDGGLIPYLAEPAEVITTTADGNELREDGGIELREDGGIELREVVI